MKRSVNNSSPKKGSLGKVFAVLSLLLYSFSPLLLTGCGMFGGPDKNYTASDISGTWVEAENPQCYWVYTLTKDDSSDYYWGKTWDEADDVHESDLEFHGNGWFKWSITDNNLVQLHMMTISEATVPKTYTVTSCNSTTLVLKDTYGKSTTYNKVK